jgi:hypothetical protein
MVSEYRNIYINFVQSAYQNAGDSYKELFRADCVIMKAFYQAKGTLILSSEDLIFVYIDPQPNKN